MRAAVFDLDGTLVDSAPDIHAAVNATVEPLGHAALSAAEVRGFIGNGIAKLIERVMRARAIGGGAARHGELTARFIEVYNAAPAERTRPYPGVRELLDGLAGKDVRLAVCTNKDHAITVKILHALELAPLFAEVVGGDTLPVRKPDPAPLVETLRRLGSARAVFVGDSEIDAETAVRAGVPFALFTGGYRKTAISDLPHDAAFGSFSVADAAIEPLLAR